MFRSSALRDAARKDIPDSRCNACKLRWANAIGLYVTGLRIARPVGGLWAEVHSYSYILQANEQNIKISIKQTQTQPQYSMPHGRRREMTPLTRDQK